MVIHKKYFIVYFITSSLTLGVVNFSVIFGCAMDHFFRWWAVWVWAWARGAGAYWDLGTTTLGIQRTDDKSVRLSRFRWQRSEPDHMEIFYPWWNWVELRFRRRLFVVAGISHEFINLSTAAILNRRTLLTAANYLDPYMDRQRELRIWALGRYGLNDTPFRYRVWRVTRLFPRSLNPEHQHGPWGHHSPRHDLAIIHSLDQMYLFKTPPTRFHYAYRTFTPHAHKLLSSDLWFAGSGYEYLQHVCENYKVFYTRTSLQQIVDCSKFLPKWWGRFICIVNADNFPCVQNGGALFNYDVVVGVGCFEFRVNEDRVLVFTDVRDYMTHVQLYTRIAPGEYYEYAYPQWGVMLGAAAGLPQDGFHNAPRIPSWQIVDDLYPLGKK